MKRTFRLSASKPDAPRDVHDEIGFHLDMRTQEYREQGFRTDEARRAALDAFGDVAAVEAECRDERARRTRQHGRRDLLGELWADTRYALRTLRRSAAFTAAAVLTLALGIGATGAVLTVVDGVLLRPMPYGDPDRLVMLWSTGEGLQGRETEWPLSPANYLDVRSWNRSFASLAAFRMWSYTLGDMEGGAEQVDAARVRPELFATLGVHPLLGRGFEPREAEAGGARVVVLGHDIWQRRFGGRRDIVGQAVTLSGERYTVVGVMPPGFVFPRGAELPSGLQFPVRTELWTPLVFTERDLLARGTQNLAAVGRLRAGVTPAQAQADVDGLAARLRREYPRYFTPDVGMNVVTLKEQATAPVRRTLLVLLGAVGFVLLIACANVTSLLFARLAARDRELAVRAALGATRARLARQLAVEGVLLAAAGAVLGLAVAAAGTRALLALVPGSLPRADDVALDARVVLVTLGVSLLAGAAFGLLAALRTGARGLTPGLQGLRTTAGASRQAARRTLVAAQVALSLVLLVGAGLLAQSFLRLQAVDPGFEPEGAMTAGVLMPIADFDQRRDGPRWARVLGRFDERLRAMPGVAAAGGVSALPLSGATETGSFVIDGAPAAAPGQVPSADFLVVTPGYLDAMRIPIVAGRGFDAHDAADAPLVVLVSAAAARRYWPGRSPIGARLYVFGDEPRTIAGIVGDVRQLALDVPANPTIYLPEAQFPYPFLSFVVRAACTAPATRCDAAGVVPAMRQALAEVDPVLALDEVRPLRDVLRESLARRRFSLVVLGAFAAAALVLSVVGLYGVIAYAVAQRTRELGVRVALGAQRGDVLRLVLGEGLRVTVAGLAVGLVAAAALTRVLRAQLFEVSTTSPVVYAAVALLVMAVALTATWIPARRATRVPPTLALHAE